MRRAALSALKQPIILNWHLWAALDRKRFVHLWTCAGSRLDAHPLSGKRKESLLTHLAWGTKDQLEQQRPKKALQVGDDFRQNTLACILSGSIVGQTMLASRCAALRITLCMHTTRVQTRAVHL